MPPKRARTSDKGKGSEETPSSPKRQRHAEASRTSPRRSPRRARQPDPEPVNSPRRSPRRAGREPAIATSAAPKTASKTADLVSGKRKAAAAVPASEGRLGRPLASGTPTTSQATAAVHQRGAATAPRNRQRQQASATEPRPTSGTVRFNEPPLRPPQIPLAPPQQEELARRRSSAAPVPSGAVGRRSSAAPALVGNKSAVVLDKRPATVAANRRRPGKASTNGASKGARRASASGDVQLPTAQDSGSDNEDVLATQLRAVAGPDHSDSEVEGELGDEGELVALADGGDDEALAQALDGADELAVPLEEKMTLWAKGVALLLVMALTSMSLVGMSWSLSLQMARWIPQTSSSVSSSSHTSQHLLLAQEVKALQEEVSLLEKESPSFLESQSELKGKMEELDMALTKAEAKVHDASEASVKEPSSLVQDLARQQLILEEAVEGVRGDAEDLMQWSVSEMERLKQFTGAKPHPPMDTGSASIAPEDVGDLERRLAANANRLAGVEEILEQAVERAESAVSVDELDAELAKGAQASQQGREAASKALKDDIETAVLTEILNNPALANQATPSGSSKSAAELLDASTASLRLAQELEVQAAGGVPMPDYAAIKAGATVVRHEGLTSPSMADDALGAVDWALHKLRAHERTWGDGPEVALSHRAQYGNCWAVSGDQVKLTVQLAVQVVPSHITIEHFPIELLDNGGSSAPQSFHVEGWVGDPRDGLIHPFRLLDGEYSLEEGRGSIQTFPVTRRGGRGVSFVTLTIESNQGNEDFTCLYGFRVHGDVE
ncbi:unnamed protein product [Chrysoparadoxa australica]